MVYINRSFFLLIPIIFIVFESCYTLEYVKNKLTTRVIKGKIARPHQFPYQVLLKSETFPNTLNTCGGSLISNEYILTAAHCFITYAYEILPNNSYNIDFYKRQWIGYTLVYLGAHDLNKPSKEQIMFKLNYSSVKVYPNYDPFTIRNDIALLKLPEPIQINNKIQIISLPPRNLPNLVGKFLTASGWGLTSEESYEDSKILRYMLAPVISHDECAQSIHVGDEATQICTYDKNGSAVCTGDSGGPNVLQITSGKKVLIGITSFNSAAGCDKAPNGLTRVTYFLDWISNVTGIQINDNL